MPGRPCRQPGDRPIFYTASEAADFSVLWHTLGVAQAIAKNDPKIAIASAPHSGWSRR